VTGVTSAKKTFGVHPEAFFFLLHENIVQI